MNALLAVTIFIACAVVAVPVPAVLAWRRARPTVVDPSVLEGIRADIEVYDIVDGVEVNRRPAYPFVRLGRSFCELANAAGRLNDQMRQTADAFQRFSDGAVRGPW